MTHPNPLYPGTSIVPGHDDITDYVLAEFDKAVARVRDEDLRGGLRKAREVAVVVAAALAGPDVNTLTGERLIDGLSSPSAGHLSSAMTLIIAGHVAGPHDALGLLSLAATYARAVATHTER